MSNIVDPVSGSQLLLLFGGSAPGKCFNDLWIFDPSTRTWEAAVGEGQESSLLGLLGLQAQNWPAVRAGHSATVVRDDVIVFGGNTTTKCYDDLWALSTASVAQRQPKWTQIVYSGLAPSARIGHSAHTVGDRMYVLGGRNNINPNPCNDTGESLHVLDTNKWEWHLVEINSEEDSNTPQLGCTGHSVVAYPPEGLLCFGGMQIKLPNRLLDDVAVVSVL